MISPWLISNAVTVTPLDSKTTPLTEDSVTSKRAAEADQGDDSESLLSGGRNFIHSTP
jgi:hypothetical protein